MAKPNSSDVEQDRVKNRYLLVDERTEKLQHLLRTGKDKAREFLAKFELSLIYHESALEGIVFSSAELVAAMNPEAIAPDASMVPIYTEIRNHKAALDFVREEARSKKLTVTVTLIKRLYDILGQGIEGRDKAVYRREMPLHRSYFHDITVPQKIPAQIEKLVSFMTTAEFREYHPLNQAATVQWSFMQIFPFVDNSGKLARLLGNLFLIRAGYLPLVIHAIDRQRYYESLRLPVATLRHLLLEAMENSLENAFKFFQKEPRIRVSRASNA